MFYIFCKYIRNYYTSLIVTGYKFSSSSTKGDCRISKIFLIGMASFTWATSPPAFSSSSATSSSLSLSAIATAAAGCLAFKNRIDCKA